VISPRSSSRAGFAAGGIDGIEKFGSRVFARLKHMNLQHLTLNMQGATAYVTLNRPEVRNAFNEHVIEELTEVFTSFRQPDAVRCVVLQAVGKAFCAGADLNWMQRMAAYSYDENLADAKALAGMLQAIYDCPVPVVARVQGDVFAGGMGLVAACDVAVSVSSARFCLSEVKLGLIPATIAPYVIRAMGPRAAHRYFLTAEVFNAQEAARTGFVHELADDEARLDATVQRYVTMFLNAGPHALAECKRLLHDVAHAPIDEKLITDTAHRIAQIRSSEQGRNGVSSFLNKTQAKWVTQAEPVKQAALEERADRGGESR
jgi:methylglutaconyl-CoA hydratase